MTMGLFMDADGIPLAFDVFPGNQNEQTTLKPLETKVIRDFECSDFIFCSDAGLGSKANRRFNSLGNRSYVITQSLKKMRDEDRIKSHFLTCYISLLVYRLLEKKLDSLYTCEEILSTLRSMQVTLLSQDSGYIPSYKRTTLTDTLHHTFGFRTDYEFISKATMRSIIKSTKEN